VVLESTTDPVRIGIALARADLWSHAELAFSQSADPLEVAYSGLARDMQGKDGSPQIEGAVAFAPDDPQVRFLQALHLRLNFDYPGSLEAIIQAVALDPENPALYAELGRAYQLAGDMATAEHWLKFAVSLDEHFQPLLDAFYADERTALLNLGLVDEAALPFDAARTPEP
jgi:tetratricopeptide (TPR) repeat protein